jgi:hypothetical protein
MVFLTRQRRLCESANWLRSKDSPSVVKIEHTLRIETTHHCPEILRPLPAELVDRIRSLVGDVEVGLDQPLPPETDGAGAR